MDPQAQPPVTFFAMVTDKRNTEKVKVCRNSCAATVGGSKKWISNARPDPKILLRN